MKDHIQTQITQTTKNLLIPYSFQELSVTLIMRTAHLRRQSFYRYFPDKYALVTGIYQTDLTQAVTVPADDAHWQQLVMQLLTYFERNRFFYRRVLVVTGQNALAPIIQAEIATLIHEVLLDLCAQNQLPVTADYIQFIQMMLAPGLFAELRRWLFDCQPRSLQQEGDYLMTFIGDTIQGLMQSKTLENAI